MYTWSSLYTCTFVAPPAVQPGKSVPNDQVQDRKGLPSDRQPSKQVARWSTGGKSRGGFLPCAMDNGAGRVMLEVLKAKFTECPIVWCPGPVRNSDTVYD